MDTDGVDFENYVDKYMFWIFGKYWRYQFTLWKNRHHFHFIRNFHNSIFPLGYTFSSVGTYSVDKETKKVDNSFLEYVSFIIFIIELDLKKFLSRNYDESTYLPKFEWIVSKVVTNISQQGTFKILRRYNCYYFYVKCLFLLKISGFPNNVLVDNANSFQTCKCVLLSVFSWHFCFVACKSIEISLKVDEKVPKNFCLHFLRSISLSMHKIICY